MHYFIGVVQGMITGIRGLCNGLGPALYGFIFYIFHVELNENPMSENEVNVAPQHHSQQVSMFKAQQVFFLMYNW